MDFPGERWNFKLGSFVESIDIDVNYCALVLIDLDKSSTTF